MENKKPATANAAPENKWKALGFKLSARMRKGELLQLMLMHCFSLIFKHAYPNAIFQLVIWQ